MNPLQSAFGMALDLELERLGWKDRSQAFDDMILAARARDDEAYAEAHQRFHSIHREAGLPNKLPASN